ncbi:uncharacterized protein [Euwallacea fornicatus]|uniref:uncharacterized protein n=1 Tax=Euwallacea fornicatus TaxID=995702 RepID=UPI00338D6EE9
MAERYTFQELTDMHLIFGKCDSNSRAARRCYQEIYPNRRIPSRKLFVSIDLRLRETGSLRNINKNAGRPRTTRTVENEEQILRHFEQDNTLSTRRIGAMQNIPHSVVWRVAKEQALYPYHLLQVQELLPTDFGKRTTFCNWVLHKIERESDFAKNILFTDEASFTKDGVFNSRNNHKWSEENPRETVVTQSQNKFKINFWVGILGTKILGPVELPQNLNGGHYLNFLTHQLPEVLEHIDLQTRRKMWLMHDGAPAHYSRNVRTHLNNTFPTKWIGRGYDAPQKWPPRSPDLNPLDFFLWGNVKEKVYSRPIPNENFLRQRIEDVFADIKQNERSIEKVQFNFLKRVRACIRSGGKHFEQFVN